MISMLTCNPSTALESLAWRRRLLTVDSRPIASGHRQPPAPGLWPWLRTRYSEAATWRETGYACLLATVAPVLSIAAVLVAPLIGSYIASPLLVLAQRPGDGPVALAFGQVATPRQALPYAIIGILLLPAVPYLLTLLAGAHGTDRK